MLLAVGSWEPKFGEYARIEKLSGSIRVQSKVRTPWYQLAYKSITKTQF